jgi:hypothetical protein
MIYDIINDNLNGMVWRKKQNTIQQFIDRTWNSYVERCGQLRVAELVQIYQKRWDSFSGS